MSEYIPPLIAFAIVQFVPQAAPVMPLIFLLALTSALLIIREKHRANQ